MSPAEINIEVAYFIFKCFGGGITIGVGWSLYNLVLGVVRELGSSLERDF